ncbi:MAG: collagenase [Roseiflexus sp.]|nr:collagenase [Roseiflexus sp.]MDW8146470.1 collagenase [Roseiflexaceae bacterium]
MPIPRTTPAILFLALILTTAAPPPPQPPPTPACPRVHHVGPHSLITMLYASGYDCTEEIARALAVVADDAILERLIALTAPDFHSLTRRNALRAIGRMAERPPSEPAHRIVVRAAPMLRTHLLTLLQTDPHDDVRADAIWILDTFFFPAYDAQPAFTAIALTPGSGSNLRTRAAYAVARLIATRVGPLSDDDLAFLLAGLQSDEPGVRARAADAIARLRDDQLDAAARARVTTALEDAWNIAARLAPADALPLAPPAIHAGRFISGIPETSPGPFAARAALARALDRFGGERFAALRAEFEAIHLPSCLDQPMVRICAGSPAADLPAIAAKLERLRNGFFDLTGITDPVPGDPHDTLVIKLFASRNVFREYMLAFVGFGADVDGIYVERDGVLYTYERDAAESVNTTDETIAHEFGHYLTGLYLFPDGWHDPGYHAEPKGWIDEGIAEYLASLDNSGPGARNALDRLCARSVPPDLARLLAQREGYDQYGTFAYDEAWAFVTFLSQERPAAMRAIAAAFRANAYRQSDVPTLAGALSLAALQAEWHAALARWCSRR